MNILIVEDGEAMRRLIRSVVCSPPHQCHECPDGSQAVAAYARHSPDWVLIDSEMKTADGVVVAGQIYAAFPGAKILIITGYDDADLRQAAHAAGACGCVLKENLLEVRRWLQGSVEQSSQQPGQ
jgi:CheY-like chemotaxis protein